MTSVTLSENLCYLLDHSFLGCKLHFFSCTEEVAEGVNDAFWSFYQFLKGIRRTLLAYYKSITESNPVRARNWSYVQVVLVSAVTIHLAIELQRLAPELRKVMKEQNWVQRMESNHLPPGYEPDKLPMLYSAIKKKNCFACCCTNSVIWATNLVRPARFVTSIMARNLQYYQMHLNLGETSCRTDRSAAPSLYSCLNSLGRVSEIGAPSEIWTRNLLLKRQQL